MGHTKVFYENGSFYYSKKQTQIAKAEPSQMQEVDKKVFYDVAFCHPENSKPSAATIWVWANISGEKQKKKCTDKEVQFESIYKYKQLSIEKF